MDDDGEPSTASPTAPESPEVVEAAPKTSMKIRRKEFEKIKVLFLLRNSSYRFELYSLEIALCIPVLLCDWFHVPSSWLEQASEHEVPGLLALRLLQDGTLVAEPPAAAARSGGARAREHGADRHNRGGSHKAVRPGQVVFRLPVCQVGLCWGSASRSTRHALAPGAATPDAA